MQDTDKINLNFTKLVNKTKEIPQLEVKQVKNCKFLKYGSDNLYPQYLYDLYNNSSQMNAIITTMKNYIIGNGIVSNYKKIVNRKYETFDNFVEKIVLDYLIFGGFAFQVIRNGNGDIAELYYLDFRKIRINEEEDTIYFNKTWDNNRVQPIVYERYVNNSRQPNSVFYYKGRLTRNQYPCPIYISAITSIEISTQIAEYHLNNLLNGFSPSVIINFNNGSNLSDEVMDEIEQDVYEKFCGSQNASKILLSFNDNTEHSTTFDRLSDDGLVDKYNTLQTTIEKDIFTAFRINKLLLGDSSENTGFNKQAYLESFALYNKTVVNPIQTEIEEVINSVLGEGALHFDEFVLDWTKTEEEDNSKVIE